MRLLTAISLALFTLIQVGARTVQDAVGGQPSQSASQGLTPAERLDSINKEVRELYDAKRYDEAAKLAEAAVEEASKIFGPDSAEVGAALSSLAQIHITRRNSGKAKRALARLLELREKRPGPSQKFEQDALEQYTCFIATDLGGSPDPKLAERISRVFREDSILAQGLTLSPDRKELQGGKVASKPQPAYPPEAKEARASGAAVMFINVDETGRVTDVTPLGCSSRAFVEAGTTAVRHAAFEPTLVNGKPVKVRGIIFYRWVIQ